MQQADDTVCDSRVLSLTESIQLLIDTRGELERFNEHQYERLNALREQLRTEASAVQANLIEQLEAAQAERDEVRRQVEALKEETRRLKVERDLAVEEAAQLRHRVEQQQFQGAEFERLLQMIKQEVSKREQETRKLEQDHAELLDLVDDVEKLETQFREQQETVRLEREALARERAQMKATGGVAQPAAPAARIINFACKLCGAPQQAPERRAGLVMKCTQCSRIVPVPKP
jgi:chromosome segregation ATPase